MSEDIVSTLSCSPVINHIFPGPCSIVSYFSEVLQHSFDHHVPRHAHYVTRTMSRRSALWITADIRKALKRERCTIQACTTSLFC